MFETIGEIEGWNNGNPSDNLAPDIDSSEGP